MVVPSKGLSFFFNVSIKERKVISVNRPSSHMDVIETSKSSRNISNLVSNGFISSHLINICYYLFHLAGVHDFAGFSSSIFHNFVSEFSILQNWEDDGWK